MTTATFAAGYRVTTSGDLRLKKFLRGDDPWDAGMNANLDAVDARLKSNGDGAVANLAAAEGVAQAIAAGSGNLLVNPEFLIWQRGTSFTEVTSHTADQWKMDGQAAVVQRVAGFNGAAYALQFSNGALFPLSAQSWYVYQRLERWKPLRGKTLTLAFDIAVTGTGFLGRVEINDGVGTTAAANVSGSTRLVISRTIDAAATLVEIRLFCEKPATDAAGTAAFTNGALAIGTYTTLPFSPRPLAEEWALCQRYYQKVFDGVPSAFRFPYLNSGIESYYPVVFTPMRAAPSVTVAVTEAARTGMTATASTVAANSVVVKCSEGTSSGDTPLGFNLTLDATFF